MKLFELIPRRVTGGKKFYFVCLLISIFISKHTFQRKIKVKLIRTLMLKIQLILIKAFRFRKQQSLKKWKEKKIN